jgi:hypothetical protein
LKTEKINIGSITKYANIKIQNKCQKDVLWKWIGQAMFILPVNAQLEGSCDWDTESWDNKLT